MLAHTYQSFGTYTRMQSIAIDNKCNSAFAVLYPSILIVRTPVGSSSRYSCVDFPVTPAAKLTHTLFSFSISNVYVYVRESPSHSLNLITFYELSIRAAAMACASRLTNATHSPKTPLGILPAL